MSPSWKTVPRPLAGSIGTSVLYATASGVKADGVSDDRAALQAAVDNAVAFIAANGVDVVLQLPAGRLLLSTPHPSPPASHVGAKLGVALPVNLAHRLTIKGQANRSTVIVLSSNGGRNAYWVNQTADYQTFQNVDFEDIDVDINGAVGRCHTLIGNFPEFNTAQKYLNVQDINVRRCRAYGCPSDPPQTTTMRSLVDFPGTHVGDNEATQTFGKRIAVEDWSTDTQQGVLVNAHVGHQYNHVYDDIYIRRGRHVQAAVPSATLTQTSVYVGGACKSLGKYEITDLYSENVGDDAIEVCPARDGRIENVETVNPYLYGILIRLSQPLADPMACKTVVRNYRCRLTPAVQAAAPTGFGGRPVGWTVDNASGDVGKFVFEDCLSDIDGIKASTLSDRFANNDLGWRTNAPSHRVELHNCAARARNITYDLTVTQNVAMISGGLVPAILANPTATYAPGSLVVRDFEAVFENWTLSGSGQARLSGIRPTGQGEIRVEGLSLRCHTFTVTGSGSVIDGCADIGQGGAYGVIRLRGLRGISQGTGAGARGIRVGSTGTFTRLDIDDCDFRALTAGGSQDIDVSAAGANGPFVAIGRRNDYANVTNRGLRVGHASGAKTMIPTEKHVEVTGTTGATVTLPAANLVQPGERYSVKDGGGGAGASNITVQRAGTDTIEGGTSKVINANFGSVALYSDGASKWLVAP